MKVPIASIDPNPFRNFGLYPLNTEHIERLARSYTEAGDFGVIPVRQHPTDPTRWQQAAGHHRLSAAKLAGMTEIDIKPGHYDDAGIVDVMVKENMSQRGYSAASALDSVAATSHIVARDVLSGDGEVAKILATSRSAYENARTKLLAEGPGRTLIYRAINGFDKVERKEKKDAEVITSTEIDAALSALKSSGEMAKIVATAHEEVEDARRLAEQAEEAALIAKARAATDAKAKAKALAAVAAQQAKAAETHTKQAEETAAIEAQAEQHPANYDIRCMQVFRLVSHEAAFRDVILSENGRKYIPMSSQLALAQKVRAEIDQIESKRGHDLGATTIRARMQGFLGEAMGLQRRETKEEEKARLKALGDLDRERLLEKFKTVKRFSASLMSALLAVEKELQGWPKGVALPFDRSSLASAEDTARMIIKLNQVYTKALTIQSASMKGDK